MDFKTMELKLIYAIKVADKGKRFYQVLSWFIAILIATAGVFTASSGASSEGATWWSTPNALIFWGLITAVGATINKSVDPSAKAEWFRKAKRAFQLILNKLRESNTKENHSFTVFEAERFRILAKEDPGTVITLLLEEVLPDKKLKLKDNLSTNHKGKSTTSDGK